MPAEALSAPATEGDNTANAGQLTDLAATSAKAEKAEKPEKAEKAEKHTPMMQQGMCRAR